MSDENKDQTPYLDRFRERIAEVGEEHSFLDLDHIIVLALFDVYGPLDGEVRVMDAVKEFFERETPWETCVENLMKLGLVV